jgi:hypothetical protein
LQISKENYSELRLRTSNRNSTLRFVAVKICAAVTMPKTAMKTKTKRTTTRSPFEPTIMQHHAEDEDIDMDDETSSDESDIPEADEAERKLERMLFGDDEGFMGALKSQQDRADAMALTLKSDDESEGGNEEAADGEEGGLEDMADADVRYMTFIPRFFFGIWLTFILALFPRLWHCTCFRRYHSLPRDTVRCRGRR